VTERDQPGLQDRLNTLRSSGLPGTFLRAAGITRRGHQSDAVADDAAQDAARRRRFDHKEPPASTSRRFDIERMTVEGAPLHLLRQPDAEQVLVYLPGGAFVAGPTLQQWWFLTGLMKSTGLDAVLFDYPKAPEHTAIDALPAIMGAFALLAERHGADNLVLVGDSVGATLALSLLMQRRDAGLRQPALALLISPCVDLGLSNPAIEPKVASDDVLDVGVLRRDARLFAGVIDVTDHRLSPRFGDPTGLAPLHVRTGGREILQPDVVEFVTAAQRAGASAWLIDRAGGSHGWPLAATPAGRSARQEMRRVVEGIFAGRS
jgi:epsilon-lactone hydrolase